MDTNYNFKFTNSPGDLEKFKKYLKKNDCPEITVDLSTLSFFETVKFVILSSAYHYQKYPSGKFKCHVASTDIKSLILNYAVTNLELV